MIEGEKDDGESGSPLVVIGASAGGVEALSTFVSRMHEGFPAPIVIAQHLDPRRPSLLAELLERRSRLSIVLVEETCKLEAGKIYVIPSNCHVRISDSYVSIEGDHADRPRPSIDLLFSTAAEAYGDRLIAVILTGSGSDGASGALEVKRRGGTVIIQNPSTAKYPSMPLALPPTAVDHVADLEQLGPLLEDLATGSYIPSPPDGDSAALTNILRTVSRQADIDFRRYKQSTIIRRIGRRMAITHTSSLHDYAELVEVSSTEAAELAMAFLIKVTEFFRDAEAFDFLRTHVIPELVEHGRGNNRVLRLWSAGCATGEEPYSLALLLADALGSDMLEWSIKIFATDIDERVLDFARRGLFTGSSLENVSEELVSRYFEKTDGGMRVAKSVRQMVIFGQQDLSRAVPFPRIDLIVCRNLLIYFKPELQQQILNSFAYSLTRNGYLFLGKAETARPSKASFELVDKRWKIYRCTNCPLGVNPAHDAHLAPSPAQRRMRIQSLDASERSYIPDPGAIEGEIGNLRRYNDVVLRLLPVGVVVLDQNYRIVTISGAARRLLGIRDQGVDQDFLHTVRGLPYNRVRAAIDTVFREKSSVTLPELELDPSTGGDGRYLLINITPISVETGLPELAVLSVTDVTEQVQTRRRLESVQSEQAQLVDELTIVNKRLSDMNKELQDANEELQAANGELMLTQEELQASNEEFEATNEELQATNEELETNNEELQATNEELEATNGELNARTQELVHATQLLELEQLRLSQIIEMAPIGAVVLQGPRLVITTANRLVAQLFGEAEYLGRPLAEAFNGGERDAVVSACVEAMREDEIRTTPSFAASCDDGNEVRYICRAVPMHDTAGAVDGLVLYVEPSSEPEG